MNKSIVVLAVRWVDLRFFLSSRSATASKSEKDRLSQSRPEHPRLILRHSVRACVSLATLKARISSLNTDLENEEPG